MYTYETMVASARVAHLATRTEDYGVQFKKSGLVLKMEAVRKRKQDMVDSFRDGSKSRLENAENLDLIMGKAKFTAPKTIEVVMSTGGKT